MVSSDTDICIAIVRRKPSSGGSSSTDMTGNAKRFCSRQTRGSKGGSVGLFWAIVLTAEPSSFRLDCSSGQCYDDR
jgi:hypothetical protein